MTFSGSHLITKLINKPSNSVIVGPGWVESGQAGSGRVQQGRIITNISFTYVKKISSLDYVPKINTKRDMLLLRSPICGCRRMLTTASWLLVARNKFVTRWLLKNNLVLFALNLQVFF